MRAGRGLPTFFALEHVSVVEYRSLVFFFFGVLSAVVFFFGYSVDFQATLCSFFVVVVVFFFLFFAYVFFAHFFSVAFSSYFFFAVLMGHSMRTIEKKKKNKKTAGLLPYWTKRVKAKWGREIPKTIEKKREMQRKRKRECVCKTEKKRRLRPQQITTSRTPVPAGSALQEEKDRTTNHCSAHTGGKHMFCRGMGGT